MAMPDTFHRAGRLLTLDLLGGGDDATPRIRRGMTNDGHRSDLARLAAFLREQGDVDGRVGLTGFCLGGRISFPRRDAGRRVRRDRCVLPHAGFSSPIRPSPTHPGRSTMQRRLRARC